MKRLDRYLSLEFLRLYALAALTLTVVGLAGALTDQLSDYLRNGYSLPKALHVFLWTIPGIYVQFSPLAVLFSCLIALGLMGKYREILILEGSGLYPFRILIPFLTLSVLISILTFTVNEKVVSKSYNRVKPIQEIRNPTLALPDFFLYADKYRVREQVFEKSNFLMFHPNGMLSEIYQADEAQTDNKGSWHLFSGSRTRFLPDGRIADQEKFAEWEIHSDIKSRDLEPFLQPLDFLSFEQLSAYLRKLDRTGISPANIRTAYYSRISYPLLNLMVVFLVLPLLFSRSLARPILITGGILLAVITYWLFSFSLALGNQAVLPPAVAAFLPHVLILAAAGVFLRLQLMPGRKRSPVQVN